MRYRVNSLFMTTRMQLGRRGRQLLDLWRVGGRRALSDSVRRGIAKWIAPNTVKLPINASDVLAVDWSCRRSPVAPHVAPGQPIIVNWVTIPAGPNSGGHTTMYRIIRYLETHGCINRLYFYNVFRGDHRYYEEIARTFYGFNGRIANLNEGMEDAHAVVATSWQTAYPVFNAHCTGARFYFVQDYEPAFYPVGALSLLAENTYRMGLHGITAGRWLAQKLAVEFRMCSDSFEFGCDTRHYRRAEESRRSGVVFYARPEAARRGFELGVMALELFARRKPEIDIHLYGDRIGKLPFQFVDHGRITPQELNSIYNRCYAGLSLSFTNVSLVPHEMLAAGCIPVVNDAVHNRIVLDNSFVRYSPPSPQALASELEAVVMAGDFDVLSQTAAASVRLATWDDAGATVASVLRKSLEANMSGTNNSISHDSAY